MPITTPIIHKKQQDTRQVWECAVSWDWLLSFVEENEETIEGLSTQGVVNKIIIPATKNKRCRYVDLIPESCASLPTYFASHVWAAPFTDLVSSLREHIGDNTKDIFVWVDIFAVNQHNDFGAQASDLKGLDTAIAKSKKTIVCIDADATLLTRIWCLFEIWHTFKLDVARLTVVTGNTESLKMRELFVDCDVANAKATVAADRTRILDEIAKSMSFETMNENIKTALVESAKLEAKAAIETYREDSPKLAASLLKSGNILLLTGNYDEAESIARRYYALMKKKCSPQDLDIIDSLYLLANALYCNENYKDSETYYREALAIQEEADADSLDIADTNSRIAGVLIRMERYEEAMDYCSDVVSLQIEANGPTHIDVAEPLLSLAIVCHKLEQYEDAENFFLKAIDIQENEYGSGHADTASAIGQLGDMFYDMKRYEDAVIQMQRSIDILEKVYGSKHPSVATSHLNIANALIYLKRNNDAQKSILKALATLEKTLPPDHPQIGDANYSLGMAMLALDDEKAKLYFQKAYAIFKKVYGPEHEDTERTLNILMKLKN